MYCDAGARGKRGSPPATPLRSVEDIQDKRERERFLNMVHTLEMLAEENKGVPVIVEGRKDERALRELGLRGEVLVLNRGVSILEFCEDLARRSESRDAIILTDWDSRGGRLAERLRAALSHAGMHPRSEFRRDIALSAGRGVNRVEILARYVERQRRRLRL